MASGELNPCRALARGLLLVGLLASMSACGQVSSKLIKGEVVEAGTKSALADAYVLARWEVDITTVAVGHPVCTKVFSVRTDKRGEFTLPSWSKQYGAGVRVDGISLELVVYKAGYEQVGDFVIGDDSRLASPKVTLQMRRFEGSQSERISKLRRLIDRSLCPNQDPMEPLALHRGIYDEMLTVPAEAIPPAPDGGMNIKDVLEDLLGLPRTTKPTAKSTVGTP